MTQPKQTFASVLWRRRMRYLTIRQLIAHLLQVSAKVTLQQLMHQSSNTCQGCTLSMILVHCSNRTLGFYDTTGKEYWQVSLRIKGQCKIGNNDRPNTLAGEHGNTNCLWRSPHETLTPSSLLRFQPDLRHAGCIPTRCRTMQQPAKNEREWNLLMHS